MSAAFVVKHLVNVDMTVVGGGGGGQWLFRTEWHPAGWSVCLPLLIFPCTIKSRSYLLAPAHPGGPRNRAVKRLWCGRCGTGVITCVADDAVHWRRQTKP